MLARPLVAWVTLGVITVAFSACASIGNPLTGPTELYGRVTSHWGQYASPFRVLGMAVDSSGKVVAQRIEWVPGGVPGFGSVYFEIDHLPVAPSYRVTVWGYTILEAPGAIQ
jgi:hypothetical protein